MWFAKIRIRREKVAGVSCLFKRKERGIKVDGEIISLGKLREIWEKRDKLGQLSIRKLIDYKHLIEPLSLSCLLIKSCSRLFLFLV